MRTVVAKGRHDDSTLLLLQYEGGRRDVQDMAFFLSCEDCSSVSLGTQGMMRVSLHSRIYRIRPGDYLEFCRTPSQGRRPGPCFMRLHDPKDIDTRYYVNDNIVRLLSLDDYWTVKEQEEQGWL